MSTLRRRLKPEMRSLIEGVVKSSGSIATRKQILAFVKTNNIEFDWWLFNYPFKAFKVQRGAYNLQDILNADDNLSMEDVNISTSGISEQAVV